LAICFARKTDPIMNTLRIIGDVHGQITADDLVHGHSRPYLALIAHVPYSVQVGDMGDGETYAQLAALVDGSRHRFFPGNHDHYDQLPPHRLGDCGAVTLGGVDFFFVRGAASSDKAVLVRLGERLGKTLWWQQEELTDAQMEAADREYLRARPRLMISHDAPTDIARLAWQHARRFGAPNPEAVFSASRTTEFLARLLKQHAPRLWVFGHHHRDWRYQEDETLFVCVGELAYMEVGADGKVR
jgi:predicted phosphodiesterase